MALITNRMTVKSDAKKTIVLLGDSFTFGHGCSDRIYHWDPELKRHVGDMHSLALGPSEHSWGRLIEQTFANVRVINMAGPGKDNTSCFSDLLLDLKEHYQDVKIDAVIFSMTFDDRIQIAGPAGFADAGFADRTQGRPIDYFKDYLPMSSWSPLWALESWSQGKGFTKKYISALELYAEHLFSPAWGAKLSHSSLFAVKGLADSMGAKFYWSAPGAVSTNSSEYIPQVKSQQLPSIIDHLKIYDKTNKEGWAYRSKDGHANDAGHKRYFLEVIKPIIEREIV